MRHPNRFRIYLLTWFQQTLSSHTPKMHTTCDTFKLCTCLWLLLLLLLRCFVNVASCPLHAGAVGGCIQIMVQSIVSHAQSVCLMYSYADNVMTSSIQSLSAYYGFYYYFNNHIILFWGYIMSLYENEEGKGKDASI